jgi:hypothetical protein
MPFCEITIEKMEGYAFGDLAFFNAAEALTQ